MFLLHIETNQDDLLRNKLVLLIGILSVVIGGYLFLSQDNTVSQDPLSAPISNSERPTISTQPGDTIPPPPPVGEDLAPGTALINAQILSVDTTDASQITVMVSEIMGYGSSTPVIAADTKLKLNIGGFLRANTEQEKVIQEGTDIKALISYQRGMAVGGSGDQGQWSLEAVKQ